MSVGHSLAAVQPSHWTDCSGGDLFTMNRTGPGCPTWHSKGTLERGNSPEDYTLYWKQNPAALGCPAQIRPESAVSACRTSAQVLFGFCGTLESRSPTLRRGGGGERGGGRARGRAMLGGYSWLKMIIGTELPSPPPTGDPKTTGGMRGLLHLLTKGPK